jgi:hypothetical protein
VKFGDYTTQMESSLPRRFATAAARTTAMPSPTLNDLTVLDTTPGTVEFWDGTAWVEITRSWVGPNAPTWTPTAGDLWLDTDDTSGGGGGITLPLAIGSGGTGATTAASARTGLTVVATGLGGGLGPPTSGTWAKGDQWVDVGNQVYLCSSAGTPGSWFFASGQISYTPITASVNLTATSAPTAQTVITAGAGVFDGYPVMIEFYCPMATPPQSSVNGQIQIDLWDGSTDLGIIAQVITPAAGLLLMPVTASRIFNPSAGNHTFSIRAWVAGTGTSTIGAGAGGVGNYVPAYLRITRA